MAKPYRQPAPGVAEDGTAADDLSRLRAEPARFNLFTALRLLDAADPRRPRLGEARRAGDEAVRLGQPPHLHFPLSSVAAFKAGGDRRPRLLTYAFGLFGPQGPLPLHVTRDAFSRLRHASDSTLADFCDVFHHRLLTLYWRAYAKARPAVEQDRPAASRFRNRIGAVAGLVGPELQGRTPVPDNFSLFAAGLLALQARPAEALSRLVTLFFAVPVTIQEFVGAWLDIPVPARTRVGLATGNARLGLDTVVGARVYVRQHRIRLVLGPLSLAQFASFLPDQDARPKLVALVRRIAGLETDWDMQLLLRRDQVPGTALDGATRLGWTSWLAVRQRPRDADDVIMLGST